MSEPIAFGLDFDNTFTAAPALWAHFIESARAAGHCVLCVTARRETDENIDIVDQSFESVGVAISTYFTGLSSKLDYMAKRGIRVDIWIDDDPRTLVNGH